MSLISASCNALQRVADYLDLEDVASLHQLSTAFNRRHKSLFGLVPRIPRVLNLPLGDVHRLSDTFLKAYISRGVVRKYSEESVFNTKFDLSRVIRFAINSDSDATRADGLKTRHGLPTHRRRTVSISSHCAERMLSQYPILHSLTTLKLVECDQNLNTIISHERLPSLTDLDLQLKELETFDVSFLSQFTKLRTLGIHAFTFACSSEGDFHLPLLTELSLCDDRWSNIFSEFQTEAEARRFFAGLPAVTKLQCPGRISASALRQLAHTASDLVDLDFPRCLGSQKEYLSVASLFPRLRSCSLRCPSTIRMPGLLPALAWNMKNITSLHISNISLWVSLVGLRSLPLKSLTISRATITGERLVLDEFHLLEKIELHGCHFHEQNMTFDMIHRAGQRLASLENLRELHLVDSMSGSCEHFLGGFFHGLNENRLQSCGDQSHKSMVDTDTSRGRSDSYLSDTDSGSQSHVHDSDIGNGYSGSYQSDETLDDIDDSALQRQTRRHLDILVVDDKLSDAEVEGIEAILLFAGERGIAPLCADLRVRHPSGLEYCADGIYRNGVSKRPLFDRGVLLCG